MVVFKSRCMLTGKWKFVENNSLWSSEATTSPTSPFAAANCESEQVCVGFLQRPGRGRNHLFHGVTLSRCYRSTIATFSLPDWEHWSWERRRLLQRSLVNIVFVCPGDMGVIWHVNIFDQQGGAVPAGCVCYSASWRKEHLSELIKPPKIFTKPHENFRHHGLLWNNFPP